MGTLATVRVNTTQRTILYREFIIQETYVPGTGNVWEWAHEDFTPGTPNDAGTCQTMFECIEAIENWHDNRAEAAWVAHQESLMESGGPDDSAYRRSLVAAGRGHLLGGR